MFAWEGEVPSLGGYLLRRSDSFPGSVRVSLGRVDTFPRGGFTWELFRFGLGII